MYFSLDIIKKQNHGSIFLYKISGREILIHGRNTDRNFFPAESLRYLFQDFDVGSLLRIQYDRAAARVDQFFDVFHALYVAGGIYGDL